MSESLTVAAAQPSAAGGLADRVAAHVEAVLAARARLVVFPELSLTGYDLAADPVDPADPALAPLVSACRDAGSVALAGAPVAAGGALFIATLAVDADGVRVAYRKTWLGAEEAVRFTAGDGPTTYVVDGWTLGLAVCKDTGVARHTVGLAALGIDAYVAGVVHHDHEAAEQHARAVVIARTCGAPVVLAGCAGPTGEGYDVTAGRSAVHDATGAVLARAGTAPGEIARARLQLPAQPPGWVTPVPTDRTVALGIRMRAPG